MRKYFILLPALFLILGLLFFTQGSYAAGASLSFSPARQEVSIDDSFTVDIILDTGGVKTDGVDIILTYDNSKLVASDAVLGDLYDNKINEDASLPGKIILQAISDVGSGFAGTGTVATVNFKAISGGLAQVSFEMEGDSALDCNVSSKGQDILASVSNGSYTVLPVGIGAGLDATASGTPTPTSATATPTVPETGFFEPTVIGFGLGGILIFVALSLLVFI